MDEGDPETINWATQNLQQYLPAPSTPSAALAQTDMNNNTFAHSMVTIAQQSLQMAQMLIDCEMDHTNPTCCAPKQLPEDIICHLLGLCSFEWDNRDLLPKKLAIPTPANRPKRTRCHPPQVFPEIGQEVPQP